MIRINKKVKKHDTDVNRKILDENNEIDMDILGAKHFINSLKSHRKVTDYLNLLNE